MEFVNPNFPCKVIVFNIKNSLYGLKGLKKRTPYEAARKYWDIYENHRNCEIYEYSVGLVDGIAETAYKINSWFPTKEKKYIGRYEFDGLETKKSMQLKGVSWRKQRALCMGHYKFGGYLVVEFDGNGKFRILKGIKDDKWRNC
jgi:hypothetical protein